MDKAGLAAAVPAGGAHGTQKLLGAERCEGGGEAAVIREGTCSCLVVFLSCIVVNKIERASTDKRSKDT